MDGERQHRRPRREDFDEDVHLCSINCYVIMRTCCCRELFFYRRYTAKNYWPSKMLSLTGIIGCIYVICQWNCYPPVTTCSSMVFVLGHIWNSGHHQQHFIIRERLLAKFIVFYIWCCYSIVAYVHLRLRLQLQRLHPSVYNYIDYSSAVGLDSSTIRVMLVLL